MNTPPDFSKYTKQLNMEQLKKQYTQFFKTKFESCVYFLFSVKQYEMYSTLFENGVLAL